MVRHLINSTLGILLGLCLFLWLGPLRTEKETIKEASISMGEPVIYWTNLGKYFTYGQDSPRKPVFLSGYKQVRIHAWFSVPAVDGSLAMQCDTDRNFGSPTICAVLPHPNTSGGWLSGWQNLADAGPADMGATWCDIADDACWNKLRDRDCVAPVAWCRIGMMGGNGVEDPTARWPGWELR